MPQDTQIPVAKQSVVAEQSIQKPEFPTEWIDLPSEGFFYPESSPLSSGRIELKCMTAKEEDILTSQNLIKKGIVLDVLLAALIVNPTIKLDDILLGDKNAIFIAARRLAYGDTYPVKVQCPKCDKENEFEVNLSLLKNKQFDFSKYQRGVNKFTFTTPVTNKTLVYKLLTHADEQLIDVELKGLSKLSKTGNVPEMTTRLKYTILSVDGVEDKATVRKFVDNMPARDSIAFRKFINENKPDIDLTFDFKCSACEHTERMALPLGVDFFWPNS